MVNIVDLRKEDPTIGITPHGLCDVCVKDCKTEGLVPQCPDFEKNSEIKETINTFLFVDREKPKVLEFVDNVKAKNGYELDISESATYESRGIVVCKNKLGKRLYFRKGRKVKEGTELEPLKPDELETLGIEESANSQLFDIDVQESTESNGQKKPIAQFNSDSIEDMKRAKEQAEARIRELGGSTEEIEDSEKEIIDNLKEKLSLQLAGKGIEINPEQIKGQEDIERWIGVIKKIESHESEKRESPSGSAPLSDGQIYGHSQKDGFSSMEEMIDSVRDKASPQNPDKAEREQNQAILNKMTEKWVRGLKSQPHQVEYEDKDVPLNERLNSTFRRRRKLAHKIVEVE